MREIKFRGKRLDNGKWIFGSLVLLKDYAYIVRDEDFDVVDDENVELNSWFQINPKTIGQYTGLKDKKRTEEYPEGKEIYEGDIVKTIEWIRGDEDEEHISHIRWASEGFRCCWWVEERSISLSISVVDELKIEVIGNIYENLELLK